MHKYVTVNYLHMLSAHKRCDADLNFKETVLKVIENHVYVKMEKGHIRRWSYEVRNSCI